MGNYYGRCPFEVDRQGYQVPFGVSSGDWAAMIGNASNRTSFAKNIKTVLDKYQLDGVDLDFEWAYSADQFKNYSLTIQEIRKVIGSDYLLTVSLHPISYKITPEAVAACDWISFQCYGPKAIEFPYESYTSHLQAAINYGIPTEKLVPGLPFYGTKTGTLVARKARLPILIW